MNFTLIKIVEFFGVGSLTESLDVHKIAVHIRIIQSAEGHICTHTALTSLHFSVLFVHFCVFKIYKNLLFTSYKKVVLFFLNEMNKTVGGLEDGDLQSSVSSEEAGWRGDPGDLLP